MSSATPEIPLLSWSIASRAREGERISGDLELVEPFDGGVLLGVVDGLGHGEEAAEAAGLAARTIAAEPGAPLTSLFQRCHEAMKRSRGAAMSLVSCRLARGELSWVGVGNVEAVLVRARREHKREWIPLRGGVVGYKLPAIVDRALTVDVGDTLILATDGIAGGFAESLLGPLGPPQELAERLLARFFKGNDDALVLVGQVHS